MTPCVHSSGLVKGADGGFRCPDCEMDRLRGEWAAPKDGDASIWPCRAHWHGGWLSPDGYDVCELHHSIANDFKTFDQAACWLVSQ